MFPKESNKSYKYFILVAVVIDKDDFIKWMSTAFNPQMKLLHPCTIDYGISYISRLNSYKATFLPMPDTVLILYI